MQKKDNGFILHTLRDTQMEMFFACFLFFFVFFKDKGSDGVNQ